MPLTFFMFMKINLGGTFFSLPCLCAQVEDWKVRLCKLFNLISSLMANVLESISD